MVQEKQMVESFQEQVWSEAALMKLLGIQRRALDRLRLNQKVPFVRLTPTVRVYLADDVL